MPMNKNALITTGSEQQIMEITGFPWGSLNIVASNKTADTATLEVFITGAQVPSLVDTVEPGAHIPAGGRYELSCRLVQEGERIFVKAPAGVVVRAEVNLALE